MLCSKCGKENDNKSEYCSYCGLRLKSHNNKKMDILIVIGLIIIIVGIFIYINIENRELTGIEQAVQDGKLQEKYVTVGITEQKLKTYYYEAGLDDYYDTWEECLADAQKLNIIITDVSKYGNLTGIEKAIEEGAIGDEYLLGVSEDWLKFAWSDGNLRPYYDTWEECLADAQKLNIVHKVTLDYEGTWTDSTKGGNEIIIHNINGNKIFFDLSIYRVCQFKNLTGTIKDNIATFDTNDYEDSNLRGIYGELKFEDNKVSFYITKSDSEYLTTDYDYNFVCNHKIEDKIFANSKEVECIDILYITAMPIDYSTDYPLPNSDSSSEFEAIRITRLEVIDTKDNDIKCPDIVYEYEYVYASRAKGLGWRCDCNYYGSLDKLLSSISWEGFEYNYKNTHNTFITTGEYNTQRNKNKNKNKN